MFFFSTNESKGQIGYWDCNPCGYGPWKYVRFERVSNCTQPNPVPGAQANSCTISISFMYRKSECQHTNQLQFKMDIIRFTNGCYAQPRCFDIDLLSEAIYWTVDYHYQYRDLYRRNAITGFENNCQVTVSPFTPYLISPSEIGQSTGCVPSCESYTVFQPILD